MKPAAKRAQRCAIYTRVSTENGLEQEFNSLHAQREAAQAYIRSQAHEGWKPIRDHDDGGFSGGSLDRPGLQKLLADIRERQIDIVVVYKVDRLTRSLTDFAKPVELFDAHCVAFVSVTQSFNTPLAWGEADSHVLLSFAQFEREVTGERIRDKIAASKKKGLWVGGVVPLGYEVKDRKLMVNEEEAATVRLIFSRYLDLGSLSALQRDLREQGIVTRKRTLSSGRAIGGRALTNGPLAHMRNRMYLGEINHRDKSYRGEHAPIIAIPWSPQAFRRRREINQRSSESASAARPIPAEARRKLLSAIAKGRRWLEEMISGKVEGIETMANREGVSERSARMGLSLAFLAPDIVHTAVEGTLPRGLGVSRLMDMPSGWADQRSIIGIAPRH
jgi:DNA invertase Pin-like site-specific DNA recombinase